MVGAVPFVEAIGEADVPPDDEGELIPALEEPPALDPDVELAPLSVDDGLGCEDAELGVETTGAAGAT